MTIADLETRTPALARSQRIVAARLARFRRQVRTRLVGAGAARFAVFAAVLVVLSFAADRLLRFEPETRLALLVPLGAALLAAAYRWLVVPLRLRLDPLDLVAVLDSRAPGLADRVAAVLELPALLDARDAPSSALVVATVADRLRQLDAGGLDRFLDPRSWRRRRLAAVVVLAMLAGAGIAWPQTARLWFARWFLGSGERWPQKTYLSVVGLDGRGVVRAARGEPLGLEIEARPAFQAKRGVWLLEGRGELLVLPGGEAPVSRVPGEVRLELRDDTGRRYVSLARRGETRFRHELSAVDEPLELRITGGDDWLGPIRIEPIDRPAVAALRLQAVPPGDSGAPAEQFDATQTSLAFLAGTSLSLTVESTQAIAAAELAASTGETLPLELSGLRSAETHWSMQDSVTLELRLFARDSGLASRPFFLSLGRLVDRPPQVSVRASGVGKRITPQAGVPLAVRASDDFGIVNLRLEQTLEQPADAATGEIRPTLTTLSEAADAPSLPLELAAEHLLEVESLGAVPGSNLVVQAAADDQAAHGTQRGTSRAITFQIVTPEELFLEILVRQRALRGRFAQAVELAGRQHDELAGDLTSEGVPALARRHQVMARLVSEVASRLASEVEELRLNRLGSPESWELLRKQVVQPLEALRDDPLESLRADWQRLGRGSEMPDELVAAIRVQHARVYQTMQDILARMAQWESFVDVLNQLDAVLELEQALLRKSEMLERERTQELFDE